jgi:putative (di)nucleoside polyphosphate hydrolase
LVAEYPDWINYEFPSNLKLPHLNKYRGQTQKWFLYYWNESITSCNLTTHDQEFKEVRFQSIDSTLDTIVSFKLDVYKLVVKQFKPIIENYLKTNFS